MRIAPDLLWLGAPARFFDHDRAGHRPLKAVFLYLRKRVSVTLWPTLRFWLFSMVMAPAATALVIIYAAG